MDETRSLPILRITEQDRSEVEDLVVREFPLTVILNNQELVTLLCTPKDLKYLAVGFLASEGLIKSKEEIKSVTIDEKRGVARVDTREGREVAPELISKRLITSGCGGGVAFYRAADAVDGFRVQARTEIAAAEVFALAREFQHRSEVYRATGGVHAAALSNSREMLVFAEDIGRHNAIDKIFGECLLNDISPDGLIAITSGRITSEILLKIARRNVPIVISKSAPTDLAVDLANRLGVTLIGFVRGRRMNVYADGWRVNAPEVLEGKAK